jgi:hypothetical protein
MGKTECPSYSIKVEIPIQRNFTHGGISNTQEPRQFQGILTRPLVIELTLTCVILLAYGEVDLLEFGEYEAGQGENSCLHVRASTGTGFYK